MMILEGFSSFSLAAEEPYTQARTSTWRVLQICSLMREIARD